MGDACGQMELLTYRLLKTVDCCSLATGCKTHLRREPSRVIGNTGVEAARVGRGVQHAAQVEVRDLDASVLIYQQAGRLQVSVQNCWLVVVQLSMPYTKSTCHD